MEHTFTKKKLLTTYLKSKINWASCIFPGNCTGSLLHKHFIKRTKGALETESHPQIVNLWGILPFRPFLFRPQAGSKTQRPAGQSRGSDLAVPAQLSSEFSSFSFTFAKASPLNAHNNGLILPYNRASDWETSGSKPSEQGAGGTRKKSWPLSWRK